MGKGFDLQGYMNNTPATKINDVQLARAYEVHSEIISGAQTAQQGLYQMAHGFKTMRDEKLFKALGYDTFADYCEKETGISRQQVYVYINVVEKLPEDLSTRVDKIGIKKLSLLSKLTDDKREEVISETDIESTTVSELRKKIKELTDGKDKAEKEAEELRNRSIEDTDEYISLKNTNTALEMLRKQQSEKLESLKSELVKAQQEKDDLEKQLSNAEEQKLDVTQTEEYQELAQQKDETISSLKAELGSSNDRIKELQDNINKLNRTVNELENRPVEVAVETNEQDKVEIERLKKELETSKRKLNALESTEYKTFAVKMTEDEYKELIKVLETNQGNFKTKTNFAAIIKSAQIMAV